MPNASKDSTTTVRVVCAIIFVIFVVSYVYSFQGDVLTMTQNVWAEGQTHYHRDVGVSIITLILCIFAFVTHLLVRLPQRFFALIFFPPMLCLGLLTAVHVDGSSVRTSIPWLVASVILFITYLIVVPQLHNYEPFLVPLRSTSFLSQPWWSNILIMVCLIMLTYSMGNTDRTLHTRLKVERLCRERQWEEALKTGFPQYDNDSSLTMLRALALANTSQLGEKLFTYNITGSSSSLAPQPDHSVIFMTGPDKIMWRTVGVVPRDRKEPFTAFLKRELRRGTVTAVAKDYLLCAYLMDRDLHSFAQTLPLYYTIDASLPAHYAEAYILYCDKYNVPDTLRMPATRTDYADFMTTMRAQKTPALRESAIREAYFGTYWYYYYKKE